MKKLRLMTVVGTRPEIIRLSRVMAALDKSEAIEHITVHTGQNYDFELNEVFYSDLGIRKPDYFLNAAGETATATIGQILVNIDPLLEQLQPDAFLVLGDTVMGIDLVEVGGLVGRARLELAAAGLNA